MLYGMVEARRRERGCPIDGFWLDEVNFTDPIDSLTVCICFLWNMNLSMFWKNLFQFDFDRWGVENFFNDFRMP